LTTEWSTTVRSIGEDGLALHVGDNDDSATDYRVWGIVKGRSILPMVNNRQAGTAGVERAVVVTTII